jgi:hypothetical protein
MNSVKPSAAGSSQVRLEDSRELGAAETLTNRAHLMGGLITGGILRITGPLTPELVRRGLDWLQDEHPILRAHLARRGLRFTPAIPYIEARSFFDTSGTERIPLRLVIDPRPDAGARALQEEIRKPIPIGLRPRMKAVLVRPSEDAETAELIICVDHTIADAQSGMRSMAQLMEYFADPAGAPPPTGLQKPLPPALESVLPRKVDGGRPYQPMIRLPVVKTRKTKIGTAVERRVFTKQATDQLKAQIRSHRVTIHGLVTAAVLKGINARWGMPEMTIMSSVDLRRFCTPPIPMETYGCYIDILRTKHRIDEPLWDLARDVTFGLIGTLARDHASASVLRAPTWEMLRVELVPLLKSGFRGDGLVVTTAGEINLKSQYGPFRVEEMTGMISQETIGAGFFCMTMEREGELEFSLCYAPHTLPAADAKSVADHAAESLAELQSTG